MRAAWLLTLLLFLVGCSSAPHVVERTGLAWPAPEDVVVVSHGWHTGLVLPADAMRLAIPALGQRFADAPYLEFGWGDQGFYQAEEITTGLTLQAMFWPTGSVMHVVGLPEKPSTFFPHSQSQSFCLHANRYARLVDYIAHSFSTDLAGNVQPMKTGLYGDSQFYRGVGDYYALNTCNKWTAKGLKSAGFDIDPTFKLTAGSIMAFLVALPEADKAACPKPPALRISD